MCDYSLQMVKSRAAEVGDKLITTGFFNSSSKGFASPADAETAVCVLPGTEIAFEDNIISTSYGSIFSASLTTHRHRVARFRQLHKDNAHRHHDALELPDGTTVMLNDLATGQEATVLQLPAQPKNEIEAHDQRRLEVVA